MYRYGPNEGNGKKENSTYGIEYESIKHELDKAHYGDMINSPFYADAVYPQFSGQEYERRFLATRQKMDRLGLDCMVVGGAPSHWNYGGAMTWLTGHVEWHAMAVYVVVPLVGEPTLIYSMGGTHIEATRRAVYTKDVRSSGRGNFGDVIADVILEKGLDNARIGLPLIDPRFKDYMPVNDYRQMVGKLPNATFKRVGNFFHELIVVKSPEEQAWVIRAGNLMARAIEAMTEAARPGVTDFELKSAAGYAIMEGGGHIDFLILASTPMDNPSVIFGNPRPSGRVLQKGDIIINELAAGFNGYSAQIGVPICVGEPTEKIRKMFDEVVLPVFNRMAAKIAPGNTLYEVWEESKFIREMGYQSRPGHLHGIDWVSHSPGIGAAGPKWEDDIDLIIKPGVVHMLEPNPITPDGLLGLFFGHTLLVTPDGNRRVTDRLPLQLMVSDV